MKRFATLFLLFVLFPATRASADPITARQILGGQYISDTQLGQFSLFGPGFNLQGRVSVAQLGCVPCTGGESLSLLSLGEVRDLSGTVDGVTYSKLFVAGSNGIPSTLSVEGSFFVPLDAVTGTQISFPFVTLPNDQFVNRFAGYLAPVLDSDAQPAFNFQFSGRGTAVATLHLDGRQPDGTPFYSTGSINWKFNSPVSPTPEPTSIVLLGTGLAALVARRIRGARPPSK